MKQKVKNVSILTVMLIFLLFTLVPILWTMLSSFKLPVDILQVPPRLFFTPTLSNYTQAFRTADLIGHFYNSVIVSTGTTLFTMVIGSLFAYALVRYPFRGSTAIAFGLLLTRMFPPLSAVLPLFVVFQRLGLIDTHLGLMLANTSFTLPFVIWILRGFYLTIPKELDEAALIDGCNRLSALYRVILPVSSPGLIATAILAFVGSWNDFFFALILTRTRAPTLPVAVGGFITEHGIAWGQITAVATFMMAVPVVVLFIIQRQLVSGLTAGAVKY
jgi:multiple sugar transport system permease protein